jgi:protein-L-isoaspartate(D-aspartate) O-methyltransferase
VTDSVELDSELEQLAAELNTALIEQMMSKGTLSSPDWRAVFEAVPRHRFVPRFRLPSNLGGQTLDAADSAQREDWLRAVYHDEALLTEFDEDGIPTTSCSAPSVVAIMLESSQISEGQSVLEIGTGTGWTAALLAYRLGSGAVTSVDISATCVAEARERLDVLGLSPTLAAGDGYQGYEPRAPYDRVMATASLRQVPPAWLNQVRPDGKILTDLRGNFAGNLALLTVHADQSVDGRFLREGVNFMPLRSEQQPWVVDRSAQAVSASGESRPTSLDPATLRKRDFAFFAQLSLPGTRMETIRVKGGPMYFCLTDPHSEGWTRTELAADSDDERQVTQGGDRRLWDELETAHELWQRLNQPQPEHFTISISPPGEQVVSLPGADRSWSLPL